MISRPSTEVLISAVDLRVEFESGDSVFRRLAGRSRTIAAVDGVALTVGRSEIVGLVGESGAGKTTLAKAILRLLEPTEGRIIFKGRDITSLRGNSLRELRRDMQMVFQEPYASLSPRLSIRAAIEEPFRIHRIPAARRPRTRELLEAVELPPDLLGRYPHEVSGGQARRVGIARALALEPSLVVADEPTSGLDVSAASSVLNLLGDLRDRLGIAYLVVTHDLSVVSYLADRLAVMYLGKIVENGPAVDVLDSQLHPYTRLLLASRLMVGHRKPAGQAFGQAESSEIPSAKNPPTGCRFHTRCPFATDICRQVEPDLEPAADGHAVACHHWQEIA